MSTLKKFAVASIALVAIFASARAHAAVSFDGCVGTIKAGSTQSGCVMAIQTAVGAFPVDGKWGPITTGKVIAWQLAHNLVGDAAVGPLTQAAMAGSTGPTQGNCPTGFHVVAPTAPTFATCAANDGSSSNDGSLSGGAGSVTDYSLLGSPSNNQQVGEDDSNTKVLGLSIEADNGSDLNIKAMRLDLNAGSVLGTSGFAGYSTSSDSFEDYATTVSIWYGSTKVASVDASEFNSDNSYAKTVSFSSNAVVKAGETGKFYVAVSAVGNLDSADIGYKWPVDVTSVRFTDAQGATISEDPSTGTRNFTFESFATANNLELKLTESSDNPDSQVVMADDNSATNGVVLLSGKLKATGGDVKIKDLLVNITSAGTGDASEIASQYIVTIDGTEWTVDSSDCTVGADCDGSGASSPAIYNFGTNESDLTINDGDTVDFTISADINEISGSVAEGDNLTADVDSADINAKDSTNTVLTGSELTGAVNGNAQAFYTTGINVTPGTVTATAVPATSAGSDGYATYTIKFNVTAIGEDVYLDKTVAASSSTSATPSGDNRVMVIDSSNADQTGSAVLASADSHSTEMSNTFKIADGATASFTLSVVSNVGLGDYVRAVLYGLEWDTANNATGSDVYTFDMGVDGSYKTGSVYVQS